MAASRATDEGAAGPRITDKTFKVAELTADPRNARRHPESQVAQIARSINQFGYVTKITVRPSGQIIGGHATLEALKRLAHETVECRVVSGLSEAAYAALALALNRIPENSTWDENILAEVLGEIREAEDLDPTATAFTTAEIDKLLKGPDAIEVREIETGLVHDEFWISVRGPLAVQADVLKQLQDVMKKFTGVSVDLGTINVG